MAVRSASAVWEGGLREGNGKMALGSGAFEGSYSYRSRFEEGEGTNPEELIGAAHAGCFSMALANGLAEDGHAPRRISTTARVHFRPGEGPPIKKIELETEGEVDGIDGNEFQRQAESAKASCPVSQALAAVDEITLEARLAGS
jgi:osmotically inducible protein OsmC